MPPFLPDTDAPARLPSRAQLFAIQQAMQDTSPVDAVQLPGDTSLPALPPTVQPKVNPPTPLDLMENTAQQKLGKLQYADTHPWGTPENHPGKLGKIAHVLSVAGNIAGNIFAPGTMSLIPGTMLNRQQQERQLQGEIGGIEKQRSEQNREQAESEAAQARIPLEEAQAGEAKARTAALENPPDRAENPQQGYAAAISDAIRRGVDPANDPHVAAWKTAIDDIAKQSAPKELSAENDLKNQILAAEEKGDTAQVKVLQKRLEDLNPGAQQRLAISVGNASNRPQRMYSVLDTQNGNMPVMVGAQELTEENHLHPGRYISAGAGQKALGQTALLEDMRGNLNQVRDVLRNPKLPEFTADQRAALSLALGNQHPTDSLLTAIGRGGVMGSLTQEQQDYAIGMAQLIENSMAMRSVLGAGQGSDELRAAIRSTLPSARTPSKDYALRQLDAFENVLNRLGRGVPNVPLKGGNEGQSPVVYDDKGVGHRYKGTGDRSDPNSYEQVNK